MAQSAIVVECIIPTFVTGLTGYNCIQYWPYPVDNDDAAIFMYLKFKISVSLRFCTYTWSKGIEQWIKTFVKRNYSNSSYFSKRLFAFKIVIEFNSFFHSLCVFIWILSIVLQIWKMALNCETELLD